MHLNYNQISLPSYKHSPSPIMTKSHLQNYTKNKNMGTSQEIHSNDRKIDLNQMRSKISGVQKMLKNRQRQFLSPTYLRGSLGANNPQPKIFNNNFTNNSHNKNEETPRLCQQKLRSSWNDQLLNMFQQTVFVKPQHKEPASSRKIPSKINRGGQRSDCFQKNKNNQQEANHQYQNKIQIPFIEGLSTSINIKSPHKMVQKSYQSIKTKMESSSIIAKVESIHKQDSKADKVRKHINKSMQVLDLIKNNQTIKARQIKKSGIIQKNKVKKVLFGFQFAQTLGKGKFGLVYLVRHIQTGFVAAIKKIQKNKIKQYNMVSQFSKEIRLHNSLDHPKVVKFYGFFQERQDVYLVLQFMNGGTLFDYLNKVGIVNIKEAVDFLRDVILGIMYLHERSIAHRDIKPQNIVISTEGVAKICDFGWSSVIDSARNTYCGTLDYACPEILQRKEYDLSVDIWSIGILTYEMLMGKAPFEDKNRNVVKQRILNVGNVQFDYGVNVPEEAKEFIEALVQKDPLKRPKIHQLFNFRLFTNFGSKAIKKNN